MKNHLRSLKISSSDGSSGISSSAFSPASIGI